MSAQGLDAATPASSCKSTDEHASDPSDPHFSSQLDSNPVINGQGTSRAGPVYVYDASAAELDTSAQEQSASSSTPASLGRRYRDGKEPERSRYSVADSINSSELASSSIKGPLDESSDSESLEGRRDLTRFNEALEENKEGDSAHQASVEQEDPEIKIASYQEEVPQRSANYAYAGESSSKSAGRLEQASGSVPRRTRLGVYEPSGSKRGTISEFELTLESHMAPMPLSAPPKDNEISSLVRYRGSSHASSGRSTRDLTDRESPKRETPIYEPFPDSRRRSRSTSPGYIDDEYSLGRAGPVLSPSSLNQTRRLSVQTDGPATHQEVVLPRWQPDAEVTLCPICRTQFSFFVRKHHCRKCGRVVCNSCSPHRITIPYQFIVQPPDENMPSNTTSASHPIIDLLPTATSSDFASLGGGERVRLCNPCVPDPNVAPPQTPQPETHVRPLSLARHHSRSTSLATTSSTSYTNQDTPSRIDPNSSQFDRARFEASLSNFQRRPRQPSILNPNRRSTISISRLQDRSSESQDRNNGSSLQHPSAFETSENYVSGISNPGNSYRVSEEEGAPQPRTLPQGHRQLQEQWQQQDWRQRQGQPYGPSLAPRSAGRALQITPIADADLCPVCHQQLPTRSLHRPHPEALREAHINDCIEAAIRGSTSPPVLALSTRVPNSTPSSSLPSSSLHPSSAQSLIPNTPEARTAAREQAHAAVVLGRSSPSIPTRRTGVFPYKATEKDCVDDAECTVCFEEFEVGDDMGRLECFCRFHLSCIRRWFETRPGQCPVHQHDGGGF